MADNQSQLQASGFEPNKRPRTEGDEGLNEEPLKDIPSQEVWMDDGNIIVAAVDQAKKERHLFKCHRGFLSNRLPVLAVMFGGDEVAKSASVSEKYEGLPIVRFKDHPYTQVKSLLECLYDASKLPYKWWTRQDTDELARIILMAHKYGATDLQSRCLEIYMNAWPAFESTPAGLARWDDREQELRLRMSKELTDKEQEAVGRWGFPIERYLPSPVTAIQVAYRLCIPEILPAALYTLHTIYTPTLIDTGGLPVASNFRAGLDADLAKFIGPDVCPEAFVLIQFLQGREWLRLIPYDVLMGNMPLAVKRRADPTTNLTDCDNARDAWWDAARNRSSSASTRPLADFKFLMDALDSGMLDFCGECKQLMKHAISKGREYIWNHLPDFFGIVDLSPRQEIEDVSWYLEANI